MQKYFLSVDIGTSALKVALFDENKTLLYNESRQFVDSAHSYKEWVPCFTSCVAAMREQHGTVHGHVSDRYSSPSDHKPALYIAISGQGPSIVYLNAEDEVIWYSAWNSNDHIELEGSSSYFLPYIRYVQHHVPESFAHVRHILAPAEYLVYTLCAKAVIAVPHRAYVPYVWSEDDIRRCAISPSLFPRIAMSGSIIGEACAPFAQELFTDYGRVFLVAGGLDYLSALIGSGVTTVDSPVLQRSGTSVVLNAIVDDTENGGEVQDRGMGRFVVPHFFSDKMNIGYAMPAYNALYAFLQEQVRTISWTSDDMVRSCARVYPRFVSEYLRFCVYSQNPVHAMKRIFEQHAVVAAFERGGLITLALVLDVQYMYDALISDTAVSREYRTMLAVSGGHAADATLMNVYAQVLNKTIRTFSPVACELRGNLALARYASGEHATIQEAIVHVQKHLPFRDYKPMKNSSIGLANIKRHCNF